MYMCMCVCELLLETRKRRLTYSIHVNSSVQVLRADSEAALLGAMQQHSCTEISQHLLHL